MRMSAIIAVVCSVVLIPGVAALANIAAPADVREVIAESRSSAAGEPPA